METRFGIIALYNIGKGWGFINEGSNEWFVHVSNCAPGYLPKLGDNVKFELGPPFKLGKKAQAINVRAATSNAEVPAPIVSLSDTGGPR